jgi:outer membrane protein
LDQAIEIGLESNYGIQISRNVAEIAANNRTLGNAGFLPSISANATRRESVENSRFETQATDGVNENRGARSTNTNAGISLNWTLFDGMNMFINHENAG